MSNSEEELERKVKELQEQMKKDIDEVCKRFGTQMKQAFFDKLHEDFKQVPPKTDHIKKCIHELNRPAEAFNASAGRGIIVIFPSHLGSNRCSWFALLSLRC